MNADGSSTTVVIDSFGNGALRDRTTTTTSANGLSKTTQFDLNGDGVVDETETDLTVFNADGSSTQTVTDRYADGTLKQQSIATTTYNQIGTSTTTTIDSNGDGIVDRNIFVGISIDGMRQEFLTYTDPNSRIVSDVVLPDGASTLAQSFNIGGTNFVTTYINDIPNANGSTEWHEWGPNYVASATQGAHMTTNILKSGYATLEYKIAQERWRGSERSSRLHGRHWPRVREQPRPTRKSAKNSPSALKQAVDCSSSGPW